MEATSGEHSQSRSRRRGASPSPSEQSDSRSSSPHLRKTDRPDHSRRKIEELIHIQDLDKLVQTRVEEASMPHHRRFRAIATDASDSPFSAEILGYEFPKKFMIPTFDCYPDQSDPVQHLRQYQDKMVIHFRNDSLCQIFPFSLRGRPLTGSTLFRNA